MCGAGDVEMYTKGEIDTQWESALRLRGLKRGLCDRLKGGMGRDVGRVSWREGTWVYLWLILVGV